jgi:glycosyltransferase involved in cell wall biosynthesis
MDELIKRIAIICNYELLPDRVGGMDYFFWLFDEKCKENNFEVNWFFPNHSNHGKYNNLTIFDSKYNNVENYFLDNFANNQYHFIFTHFIELSTPFFKKLKCISRAKVIVIDHNSRPLNGYPLRKQFEKRIKGILFSKYIDLFVGVSKYTVKEISEDFGFQVKKKTIVIYNGVITKDIQFNSNRRDLFPKFLVVSHLTESKGIQDLIDAIHILPNEIKSKLTIDIYGDGYYKEALLERINKFHLVKVFSFKGSIPNLKEVYCKYDYMLQPTHMECFSLSILESLAANVPVITTSVGGNEEVITHGVNGFIVKPKDHISLKTIIENIYIGNISTKTNTRELIEDNFTIEKMVNNYLKLILCK